MIRTTYKGRKLRILAVRNRPDLVRTLVNDHPISHGFQGTDIQALDNLRLIIDRIDAAGPGNNPYYPYPFWYAPGTFDLNVNGHPITPGGTCTCDSCLSRPEKNLPAAEPDSCQHCSLPERTHARQWTDPAGWHTWTPPTPEQRKGRMLARRTAKETS